MAERRLYGVYYKTESEGDKECFAYVYAMSEENAENAVRRFAGSRIDPVIVCWTEELNCGLVAFLDGYFFECEG